MRRLAIGLSWKIQLALIFLSAIPICATILAASPLIDRLVENQIRHRINEVANFVERSTVYSQLEYAHNLQLLAENRAMPAAFSMLRAGKQNAPEVTELLDKAHGKYRFDIIKLLDVDGDLLLRSARTAETEHRSGLDHPVVEASLEGESTYEITMFDGWLAIVAAAPVKIGDETAGHLVGAWALDEEMALQIRSLSGAEVAFFDRRGVYARSLPGLAAIDLGVFAPTTEELRQLEAGTIRSRQIRNIVIDDIPFALTTISLGGSRQGALIALDNSELLAASRNIKIFLFAVLAVAIALATSSGIAISRHITRPLIRVVRNLEDIADGGADLTRKLEVASNDEVGKLAASFNRFMAKLRGIIGRTLSASVELVLATEKIRVTSGSVGDGARRQAAAIEESYANLHSMDQGIAEIVDSTGILVRSAEQTSSATLEVSATNEEVASQMERLFLVVEDVSSSVRQMSATNRHVFDRIHSLSSSLTATASSVQELDSSIHNIEEKAETTRKLSEAASKDARQGQQAVTETLEGIDAIRDMVEEASTAIQELGSQSTDIGRILTVIEDVTAQTQLLALNAAIIAAQAGVHGKGFAVVAKEISGLAERTALATREIVLIIAALQDRTRSAMTAMQAGTARVQEEVERSRDTGHALEQIQHSTTSSAEQVRQIVQATAEQARESGKMTGAIGQISALLDQIVAAVRQQADGSDYLARNADAMRAIASQVKTSTVEQATSSREIGATMESMRAMIERIDRATRDHARRNREILDFFGEIREITEANRLGTGEMDQVVAILSRQTAILNEEIGSFQIDVVASGNAP